MWCVIFRQLRLCPAWSLVLVSSVSPGRKGAGLPPEAIHLEVGSRGGRGAPSVAVRAHTYNQPLSVLGSNPKTGGLQPENWQALAKSTNSKTGSINPVLAISTYPLQKLLSLAPGQDKTVSPAERDSEGSRNIQSPAVRVAFN